MLTHRRFQSLDDWLAFCRERGSDTASLSEAERVDAVQAVSRLLAAVSTSHEDGAALCNLWLARYGNTHRLFPVVGKRTRKQ
jgi:hypothetical protein